MKKSIAKCSYYRRKNAAAQTEEFIDESRRYVEYFPKEAINYFGFGFRKFAYKTL